MISVNTKADCCGCAACASICSHDAITMTEDEEGFLYPVIDGNNCIECGACEKSCPVIFRDRRNFHAEQQSLYACHHKDEMVWQESSSGGIFTALTEFVFSKGGVVYGAIYDEDLVVIHKAAENEEDAILFRGSKYSQSDVRGIYLGSAELIFSHR